MLVLRGPRGAPADTVLTIGNFDGVHLGHQALLARVHEVVRANPERALLPAVLTFEPHPREFFAPANAPARLATLREKLELLAEYGVAVTALRRFDAAFSRLSAEAFIRDILVAQLRVRHLIIGDDFHFGARRSGNFAALCQAGQAFGFVVEAMPTQRVGERRVSSTEVRDAMAAGDMASAGQLLGRPYAIDGRVVHGDKRGRQLGFPTANIRIKHDPLPLTGVFAVEVTDNCDAPQIGVANLGVRPTVDGVRPLLEVHLFDFSRDLYGVHLTVRFLHKLRAELKFSGLDALQAQIAADCVAARAFFAARAAAQ